MKIILGKTECSMINPPGIYGDTVLDKHGTEWRATRTGQGNVMLGHLGACHPDFMPDGMDLQTFIGWVNEQL